MSRHAVLRFGSRIWRLTAILVASLAAATTAQARIETLQWTHSTPEKVAGFQVYMGSASRNYGPPTDVGLPAPSGGVYSAAVDVGDDEIVFVAITAYDDAGEESLYSNERVFEPPPPSSDLPSGAALHSESFDGYAAGGDPTGWLDTGAHNSLSENDSLFSIATLAGNPVLSTSSTLTNIHSHFSTPDAQTWSSYEYRGRMRISQSDGGIGVTALSQYPREDAYYRLRRHQGTDTEAFHLSPHPDAVGLTCSSASTGVVPEANTWYRFRLQVLPEAAATYVRAKVWAESGTEPAGWQADCVDRRPDRLSEGGVGVWSMGPGAKYWDDLAVIDLSGESGGSSGADPEPIPLGKPGRPVLIQ